MLKEEFLKLTGRKSVSDEEYGEIESVYNELDYDKTQFCDAWSKGDAKALRKFLVEIAEKYRQASNSGAEWKKKAQSLARAIIVQETSEKDAYEVLGTQDAIKVKIKFKVNLTEYDRSFLLAALEGK